MKAAQAADGTTSRRNAPAPAGLILAFAAFVPPAIAQTPDRPAAGAPSPAALEMTWSGSTLQLRGNVSSTAHEMILRDSARRFFGADVPVQQELTLSSPPRTPPGWALVTDMVLRAIAETRSATATVTPSRVRISGVARATADLDTAMARIGKALTDGMSLDQRIVTVSDAAPFGVLCRRQLLSLTRNRRVEFHRAGAELRSGAFPTLDAIAGGTCHGTVVQNPYLYGYESVKMLTALANGDRSVLPKGGFLDIPARKITSANVAEFKAELKELTASGGDGE